MPEIPRKHPPGSPVKAIPGPSSSPASPPSRGEVNPPPRLPPGGKVALRLAHAAGRFNDLVTVVQRCTACPSMTGRRRVLSNKNGAVGVKVMFVAEAPGKAGAERTGVPIHGDPSGNAFERMLESVGWTRADVFVTNAVLCNPRWENGNNRPPEPEELTNCSFHLERQIALVGPYVIATLGRAALEALSLIEPHSINMSHAVATPVPWNGRVVFPLYHPSPRAVVTRPYADQLGDFRKLKEYADAIA